MPTNREFLNTLAREDPAKLTEWMDAEHVDACDMEDTFLDRMDADGADTRDSAGNLWEEWTDFYNENEAMKLFETEVGQLVFDLLDRQAAITERECEARFLDGMDAVITRREAEKRELQERLDAALAIVEELRGKLGTACDRAHEIVTLVTLDGEVVG